MLCKVAFLGLLAFAAAQVQLQEQFPPHPYTFSYESTGEDAAASASRRPATRGTSRPAATGLPDPRRCLPYRQLRR
ncbi:cuticle protein 10.9 [Rhipicephalus sanguineus]|uniref:cuticle protein 10.9 n=1 Tax=Rhipicephalus sanguineus TaxID=34632 RepID=UPI001894D931|nr:cuticle protein 10.9 [Rhipicephalus sanguineus]